MTTGGVVFVNDPDMDTSTIKEALPDNWDMYTNDRNVGALGALNFVLRERPDEKFYGFIGDDEFVETEGWDGKLVKAAGDWCVAHGDDGVHRGKRAQGCLCIGGKLARAVGYLAIPACWHWYGLDDMWETLARAGACGKQYVPGVKVAHWHPYFGKGARDACYELGESKKDIDFQEYAHWCRTELPGVVARVKAARGLA
jgi:hypothetical protein